MLNISKNHSNNFKNDSFSSKKPNFNNTNNKNNNNSLSTNVN